MSERVHDIGRLQAMDEAAWAALQDDYYRRIYFYVKRYTSEHQTAEDLTQDVFLGAVRGIAGFDPAYTLDQFLFGIAKNRVIDHYRKHKLTLIPGKADDGAKSQLWLENLATDLGPQPKEKAVRREDESRQREVLAQILRDYTGELWAAGEFQKLMVLEFLFVLGGRNKDAAVRFGIADEKSVAGIKFRAVERLRGLARQHDPNHSLFLGLWQPGAR
ncbi:MAG: sigma-70 family RNA polymerase sigma factor [Planctomycetes bacterium]|jgi:RNA polymerase sigma-70 factor (ECF subfamily)|nr:sigma-70 family RNA polymerase sigma factor [Planctomycetota bacterium]